VVPNSNHNEMMACGGCWCMKLGLLPEGSVFLVMLTFHSCGAPNYDRIVDRYRMRTLGCCATAPGGAPTPMTGSTKDRQSLFSPSTLSSSSWSCGSVHKQVNSVTYLADVGGLLSFAWVYWFILILFQLEKLHCRRDQTVPREPDSALLNL
jgi:hypothetical protein